MADSFTPNLNLRKPEVGAAFDTWGGTTGLNSDMDILDLVFMSDGSGTPVGLQLAAGKVWSALAGIFNLAANVLFVKDATDQTKVVAFDASLLTTGTTRTLQFPDENGVIATMGDVRQYLPTGTVLSGYYGGTAPPGFVAADGRTIGNASSGAVNRANADCQLLFVQLWLITTNAQCPVLPGGRGASALADWNANKTIALPNHCGRTMAGRDDLGGSAEGVWPGATTRAAVYGALTSATGNFGMSGTNNINFGSPGFNQTSGSIASASATAGSGSGAGALAGFGDQVAVAGYTNINGNFNINVIGASGAFNIVQPTIVVDVIIAL